MSRPFSVSRISFPETYGRQPELIAGRFQGTKYATLQPLSFVVHPHPDVGIQQVAHLACRLPITLISNRADNVTVNLHGAFH